MKTRKDSARSFVGPLQAAAISVTVVALAPFALSAQATSDSSILAAKPAATAAPSTAAAVSAQLSSEPLMMCIVPGSGTAYRVGEPGLPTQCLVATHTLLTLNMTGPQGMQGLTGPKGDSGAVGAPGAKGDAGAMGPTGPAGSDGAAGVAGAIGASGEAGAPGPTGPKGDAGTQGAPGEAGSTGPMGPTGPIGPQGTAGETGATGAAGAAGPVGLTGPEGAPGTAGVQGTQGIQGIQGIQGEQGAAGTTDHSALSNLTVDTHPQYLLAGERTAYDGFSVAGTVALGASAPSGGGTRLVWSPQKAAFRAGRVANSQWDPVVLGYYSAAFGNNTTASGQGSIAGGMSSLASGSQSFAMGQQNTEATGLASVAFNGKAYGDYAMAVGSGANALGKSSIALGEMNTASGDYAIAIGYGTTASGEQSVAIGSNISAMTTSSVVIGRRGRSNFAGSVVISAESNDLGDLVQPTAENQFVVRAGGGIRFYTTSSMVTGVAVSAGGGSWDVVSDRNKKSEFRDVDGESLLTQLRTVPVSSWKYKAQDKSVRHIGPMAQDWQKAFGLTSDSTTINSGDIAGVTLAGVQALDARTSGTSQRILSLEDQVRDLQQTVQELVQALRVLQETQRKN